MQNAAEGSRLYLDGGNEPGTRALAKVIQDSLPGLRGRSPARHIPGHRCGQVHALGDPQPKHSLHARALLACTAAAYSNPASTFHPQWLVQLSFSMA